MFFVENERALNTERRLIVRFGQVGWGKILLRFGEIQACEGDVSRFTQHLNHRSIRGP
jgi:hypothetical protein